jgi:FlaA1/EpsC-like NDP-sugar epimerase
LQNQFEKKTVNKNTMKTALIIGSTGLIGSDLVKLLFANSDYSKIIAFSKKEVSILNIPN